MSVPPVVIALCEDQLREREAFSNASVLLSGWQASCGNLGPNERAVIVTAMEYVRGGITWLKRGGGEYADVIKGSNWHVGVALSSAIGHVGNSTPPKGHARLLEELVKRALTPAGKGRQYSLDREDDVILAAAILREAASELSITLLP